MEIKKRLKKLENELTDDSQFCACRSGMRIQWFQSDLGEGSNTSEPVLMGKPIPDICPDCLKTIEKRDIILQLCDGTSKDRFPEEWYGERNK